MLSKSLDLQCSGLWALVFVLLCLADLPLCFAGSLGTRAYSNYERLRVTYTPDPVAYCACNEMTITVTTAAAKPSSSDRDLEFVFYVAGYYRSSAAYRTRLTLPEGATSATTKLFFRQPYSYANWLVDVSENGRSIVYPEPVPGYLNANQAVPGLDCCEIASAGLTSSAGLPLDYSLNGLNVNTILVQNAPADWRVYMRYGLVVWPIGQLATATEEQMQALSQFVLSGGTLVVYYVDPSQLKDVDQYLSGNAGQKQADYRWVTISESGQQHGHKRPHGGGQVLCLESVPANLMVTIKTSTQYPVSDLVNDANIDDIWFWRNLVQTVGKTPVWTFNTVVILFATLVGPVLLIFTSRIRQRTLMLLLVPAISAVLTLLILFYNIVREGFDTRGRISSIQYFDVPSGQGHAWSRQSFFSGAPPTIGLKYSRGCLLNPVDTNQEQYGMVDPRNQVSCVLYSDGQAQYLRDWLAPRSQQQVSVGHALHQVKLPIQVESLDADRIKLNNLAAFDLPLVLLRGAKERYYFCSRIDARQSIELEPQSLAEVESQLYRQWRDYLPEAPPEIDTTRTRMGSRTRGWYGHTGRSFVDPLEKVLNSRSVVNALSEYGYLIVTKNSSNIETPFSGDIFENEQNFHLLMGANPW